MNELPAGKTIFPQAELRDESGMVSFDQLKDSGKKRTEQKKL